jgi:N-acylneuraminate cytidylyltransferase
LNVALIPARAGSKRIANKNTKIFNGKPLIAYSIEAALESGLFDHVIVSTDSPDIAKLSQELGASAPFTRPDELSDDFTGTQEVIAHGIKTLQDQGMQIDYCCCIYATAPFLQVSHLQQGYDLLKQNPDKAFALSISTFDFPVQRALIVNSMGMAPMFPAFIASRSQDLEEAFHDAGQFYWGSADDFLSKKPWFSEHALGVNIPRHLVQDIDTPEDWLRAELMYKAYMSID